MMEAESDYLKELAILRKRVAALEQAAVKERNSHRETRKLLRALMDYAPEAIVILDVDTGHFIEANPYAEKLFGLPRRKLLQVGPFDLSPMFQPNGTSRQRGREKILEALKGGTPVFEWWHSNARGERFPCEIRLVKVPLGDRQVVRGTIMDITDRKQAQLCERLRNRVLETIARAVPLATVLDLTARLIEEVLSGVRCSILILDEGKRLRLGAAPSLPDFFNAAVDGLLIGPTCGSCGAAAHSGKRVIVSDLMRHPNWTAFRQVAKKARLMACWSEPVLSDSGKVLGTFAMYYRESCEPTKVELRVIEVAAELAAIAIEREGAHQQSTRDATGEEAASGREEPTDPADISTFTTPR